LNRSDFLERRRLSLGASDVGILFAGTGDFSALAVQASKLGLLPESEPIPRLELGLLAEPIVSRAAEARLGPIYAPGQEQVLFYNDSVPYCHATPDRFLAAREKPQRIHPATSVRYASGVVELKTWVASQKRMWDDGPPLSYMVQLQHQLLMTGLPEGRIVVMFGLAEDFEVFGPFGASPKFQNRLRSELPQWWLDHVVNRLPVKPVARDGALLAGLYPKAFGATIALPASFGAVYDRLRAAKEAAKLAEQEADLAENEIKQALGEAEVGVIDSERAVSWRNQIRQEKPREAKTIEYRVFRSISPTPAMLEAVQTVATTQGAQDGTPPEASQ
jgi:predicted phage-related endonuclease